MEMEVLIWCGLMILFLVVEIATVGLTSIWLAGGALAALIVAVSGPGIIWQLTAFVVVSFILLVFTRPFAKKYINSHHEKTNYEELIGGVVKVTETVDNIAQTQCSHREKSGLPGRKMTVRGWKRAHLQRLSRFPV